MLAIFKEEERGTRDRMFGMGASLRPMLIVDIKLSPPDLPLSSLSSIRTKPWWNQLQHQLSQFCRFNFVQLGRAPFKLWDSEWSAASYLISPSSLLSFSIPCISILFQSTQRWPNHSRRISKTRWFRWINCSLGCNQRCVSLNYSLFQLLILFLKTDFDSLLLRSFSPHSETDSWKKVWSSMSHQRRKCTVLEKVTMSLPERLVI